jgi:hypothetical protein
MASFQIRRSAYQDSLCSRAACVLNVLLEQASQVCFCVAVHGDY